MGDFNPGPPWLGMSPSCPGTVQHVHGCVFYEALYIAGPILGAWGGGRELY